MVRVTISPTLANEWATRGITDVIPTLPEIAYEGGVYEVDEQTARDILADAQFNADKKNGPEQMPAGTRKAYAAIARALRELK